MADAVDAGQDRLVQRRRRAWWQWAVGVILLGAAGFLTLQRYVPALQRKTVQTFKPHKIVVLPELRPAEQVPRPEGDGGIRNVLLVSMDTTRADHLGCYGNDKIKTPTLDRLAREGVLFSDAGAVGSTTLPGHASMLTGLYPIHHGARANGVYHLAPEQTTLAEILRARGYATGAMISAAVLSASCGLDQGFEDYDQDLSSEVVLGVRRGLERPADQTTDRALEWLRIHSDEPFMAWVHYFDPHVRYEPPPPFDDEYKARPYDGEIAFVDSQLARLLNELDDLGLTDSTLVIVAGDHGESLGEHQELTHGIYVYDATVKVPFILRAGTRLGGGIHIDRQAGLVDIVPTALSLLGFDVPDGLDGIDLTATIPPKRTMLLETLEGLMEFGWVAPFAVRDGAMKYIFGVEGELYDLKNDPFETNDLIQQMPEVGARLHKVLESYYPGGIEAATANLMPTRTLTPEEAEKMQALGYVGNIVGGVVPAESRANPRKLLRLKLKAELAFAISGQEGKLEEAIRELEKLAVESPKCYPALRYLGEALAANGDYERAAEMYDRCLELNPGVPYVLETYAALKIAQGDTDGAVEYYLRLLEFYPEQLKARTRLAGMLLADGRYEEAFEQMVESLRQQPRDQRLMDMALQAATRAEKNQELTALFEELLAESPDLAVIRNALAGQYAQAGDIGRAVDLLRKGVELHPKRLELANNLALLLATSPDPRFMRVYEAAGLIEEACRLTKYKQAGYIRTLARVYATMRRMDEAIAAAKRAQALATEGQQTDLIPFIEADLQYYEEAKRQGVSPMAGQPPAFPDAEDKGPDGTAD